MPFYRERHTDHGPGGGPAATPADASATMPTGTPAQAPSTGPDAPDLPVLQQAVGSPFADAEAARQAVALALPMIEQALRDRRICGSGFLYIVVMDPALGPGDARFEDAILLEHAIGARDAWDADYGAFARAKARLSWQHGQDGHRIQGGAAHRLRTGDSLLWGSVCLDGIVVGVSGAFAWYDEAFATAVAANLRAIAKQRHAEAVGAGQLWVA
jgi:hypothetical protein